MVLLHGKKRKILKMIVKYYKKNKKVPKSKIEELCKFNSFETEQILMFLYRENYFTYSAPSQNIILTAKGLCYFADETQEVIEIGIKSIVFPIIVSIITTLLTLWLKGLL